MIEPRLLSAVELSDLDADHAAKIRRDGRRRLMLGKYHIATAAEAIAAAQFARLGCNVAVQYGANQPEYDLVISNGKHQTLPVSVNGNATGSWLLAPRMLENYHATIDDWLKKHGPRTVYCLVQFKDVSLGQMPRILFGPTSGDRDSPQSISRRSWARRSTRKSRL